MTLFREGFSGEAFLLCVFTGFFSAVVYDVIHKFCRLFVPGKTALAVADMVSCLLVAAMACIVSLPVSFGQLRFFQLMAELLGAVVYFLSFGRLTGWAVFVTERMVRRLKKWGKQSLVFLCKKHPAGVSRRKKMQRRCLRKKIGKTRKFP